MSMTMLRQALQQATKLLTVTQEQIFVNQARNTCVVKRMYPPRTYKKYEPKHLKRREYVYILEEMTHSKPLGNMELILTRAVEGIGLEGDVVTVKKNLGRNKLLPSGLAVYPSPENLAFYEEKFKDQPDRLREGKFIQRTLRQLKGMNLPIPMNAKVEWTLNNMHVKAAFRKLGVEMTEDCIELPKEPITEPGEFTFNVTVNNLHTVSVNGVTFHHSEEIRKPPGLKVFNKSKPLNLWDVAS